MNNEHHDDDSCCDTDSSLMMSLDDERMRDNLSLSDFDIPLDDKFDQSSIKHDDHTNDSDVLFSILETIKKYKEKRTKNDSVSTNKTKTTSNHASYK